MLGDVEAFDLVLLRTRSGTKKPITLSSTKVTTPDQTSVTRDAVELDQHLAGVALQQTCRCSPMARATANTPASSVPVAPPTPCTPNTSSESS